MGEIMKKKSVGIYIIASAIVWGAVIIGCSLKLRGTGCYDEISFILIGGVIFHLLFIWSPLAIQFRQRGVEKRESS
jgi:hypothetical protein